MIDLRGRKGSAKHITQRRIRSCSLNNLCFSLIFCSIWWWSLLLSFRENSNRTCEAFVVNTPVQQQRHHRSSLSLSRRYRGYYSPSVAAEKTNIHERYVTGDVRQGRGSTNGLGGRGRCGNIRSSAVTSSLQALSLPDLNLEDMIYAAQSSASKLAASTISGAASSSAGGGSGPSLSSLAVLYAAGLLTSFSPCSLGLLPLTVSYISNAAGEREDKAAFFPTVAFASGLAAVFCALGLSASLLGGVFGSNSAGGGGENGFWGTIVLATLSSGVSVAMGLQLLDIIRIPLPSFELKLPFDETVLEEEEEESSELQFDEEGNLIPPGKVVNDSASTRPPALIESPAAIHKGGIGDGVRNNAVALFRTFLLGGSSALVASPCATPVLTSILAFVAASRDPTLGAALLVTYTLGYSTPLLVVGATGGEALAKAQAQSGDGSVMGMIGRLVTPLTAAVLIWYGTTGFLNAVFGDPSLAGLAPVLE